MFQYTVTLSVKGKLWVGKASNRCSDVFLWGREVIMLHEPKRAAKRIVSSRYPIGSGCPDY